MKIGIIVSSNIDFNYQTKDSIRNEIEKYISSDNFWYVGNGNLIEKYCVELLNKNNQNKQIINLKFDNCNDNELYKIYRKRDLYITNSSNFILLFISSYNNAMQKTRYIKDKKTSYVFLPYKRR